MNLRHITIDATGRLVIALMIALAMLGTLALVLYDKWKHQ